MGDFIVSDLGYRSAGSTVTIELQGSQSKVMLMDPVNFERFKKRQRHQRYGHVALTSPARITVPADGTWKLVVEPVGGSVTAKKPRIQ